MDLNEHLENGDPSGENYDELIFVDRKYESLPIGARRKLRNVFYVNACDVAIFISGRIGTMNEFSNAYDMGKNIGVFIDAGGFSSTAQGIVRSLGKQFPSTLIYFAEPKGLIERLELVAKK